MSPTAEYQREWRKQHPGRHAELNRLYRQRHPGTPKHKHEREYRSWIEMKRRCYNPKATRFERYGGRGITVCDRWRYSFENFLADMGPRPIGMTLDRFPNNDGNYEPSNCRWATPAEQNATRTK